jgi:hypothetical protein
MFFGAAGRYALTARHISLNSKLLKPNASFIV